MDEITPFQRFIDLITFDQAIVALEKEVEALQKEVQTLEAKENEQQKNLERVKIKAHNAKKEVDEKELEMKALDAEQKIKKAQLETSANNKIYQAIKSEIEIIKRKQLALEEELIIAWNAMEASQKEYIERQGEVEKNIAELQAALQEKSEKIEALKRDVAGRAKIRPEKERQVPEEWLEKYAMMRARVPDPVVPVLHGSCSACFYTIPGQDLIFLKRKKLLQCKFCYRFLYFPDAQESKE